MALAAIQASYDDEEDEGSVNETNSRRMNEQLIDDQMAVINDPSFSVMSKIKLNLTPAVAIQVRNQSSHFQPILFVSSQRIPAVFWISKLVKFTSIQSMKTCMHPW